MTNAAAQNMYPFISSLSNIAVLALLSLSWRLPLLPHPPL
jgi:uncharacterized membrane protein